MARYKAEIFDRLQFLFDVTKFNDHQLHFVIRFDGKLNADVMGKAAMLLLQTIPILSCRYIHNGGNDYWEVVRPIQLSDTFSVVDDEADFELFITSKIDTQKGPQMKMCLYSAERDALAVTMNHMVCDAAGFKKCLYLLANIYSNMIQNPDYAPDTVIDGDRGIRDVLAKIGFWDKVKIFLFQMKENNKESAFTFPMSEDEHIAPFILTHTISRDRFTMIRDYCKRNRVTINDVVLTAYYRALSKVLNTYGSTMDIPIMVDMRKYIDDSHFTALSNLTSTVNTRIEVDTSENFEDTLAKVHLEMNRKKEKHIGISGFAKLSAIFGLCPNRLAYHLIKNNLHNPNICMTNIGILDSDKLACSDTPTAGAYMTGSIKYRPHFQIALSSFENEMTFSTNLYGSFEDRNRILNFYTLLDNELPKYDCPISSIKA